MEFWSKMAIFGNTPEIAWIQVRAWLLKSSALSLMAEIERNPNPTIELNKT
jgi:hypothetical protein